MEISVPKDGPVGSSVLPPRRGPPARKVERAPRVSRFRFVRAYVTTYVVILSYLWLRFLGKVVGRAYYEERVAEVHRSNARRVYETIVSLQGLFIKVGQLLSIMANFLPAQFRDELEGLQDKVPPRPYDEISETLEGELGGPIDTFFADFAKLPVASASLGQVHEAHLKDGRHVCVKVQHADIDEIVRLDLLTIRRIMKIVRWFVPVEGLDAYYHQIRDLLRQELDFQLEADNIDRISKNFSSDAKVVFPRPVREHSTHRVLTTTFVEGRKISDIAAIEAMGVDKRDLAERLLRVYCQMIFVDGVYHADPHPGNIMVQRDGSLILLDFGAVAELSPAMREGAAEFLEGVLRRDTEKIIVSLRKMGFLSKTSDPVLTERIIEYFHRRFQEEVKLDSFNLKDVKLDPQRGIENLLDLRKMNVGLRELSSAFHIPKDWVLLERTIILLYGCCSLLDSELNPVAIVQPYLYQFVFANRDWAEIAMEAVRDMAMSAITLPEDLKRVLTKTSRGELEVRSRDVVFGAKLLYGAVRQVIWVSIFLFCAFEAVELRRVHDRTLAGVFLAGAVVSGVMFLIASFLGRPRMRG